MAIITIPATKELSYSSLMLLNSCPRKYQLTKGENVVTKEKNQHLAYGSAFGVGLQALLSGESLNNAILKAISAYDCEIDLDYFTFTKSIYHCIEALKIFYSTELNSLSTDWEALMIDGKPASEVSFAIKLPSGYLYRGYIDFILKSKVGNTILIVEAKTDGSTVSDSEMRRAKYANSTQGTGYAVVADYIAHKLGMKAELAVAYIVNFTVSKSFEGMIFDKTPEDRIRFLENLVTTASVVEFYGKDNKPYPISGSCLSYNRVCNYYGICNSSDVSVRHNEIDLEKEFQFVIPLHDLLTLQKDRLTYGEFI